MRQTTVLGLLACVCAAVSLVVGQTRTGTDHVAGNSHLLGALGAPEPNAPLVRRPARGVRVRIDSAGFRVAASKRRLSIRGLDAGSARWARYSNGVARSTRFGHETVVVTPVKAEQFLTVASHHGLKTWRWRLDAGGLSPRVGADGAVAFLTDQKLAGLYVEPVAITDLGGRDITPEGLRWSVSRDRHGWLLGLRLDDRRLPLPYVIDPSVKYRLAQTSDNGAAGGTGITLSVPAGVANNDLLVMHIAARGGGNMTIATPAGWTALRNANNSNQIRLATFYRVASSEPASYTVSFGGSNPSQQAVGAITAYYGVKANTSPGPLDVDGATNTGNSSTPTANSITAAANTLVFAAYSHATGNGAPGSAMFTTAAGMYERYDAQSQDATANNRSSLAGDDILSFAGGATGNKAVTASASGRWVAHQVSFNVDDVSPSSTTAFPAAGATYRAANWNAGCSPSGICGTASDNDSSVSKVEVSVRQGSGNYWDGSGFSSATEVWNLASGTTSWDYGFAASNFPAEGSYTIRVQVTDTGGNVSTPSSETFTYDATAPALPTGLASNPAGPANNNSPAISGTSEAGSTVKLYTTSDCSGSVAASGSAASFASPGLTVAVADDSTTTFKATATDAAGNVSGCSASFITYVEDSTAPALPSGLASSPASPANDNSPAISGTAEAGSTVKLYTTSDCSGTAAATGSAASFSSPGLTVAVANDSTTTFKATATDAAGNVSGCSASSVIYVEDSTAPALPSSLASTPAGPANDNSPAISGTAEAGSTVKLYTTSDCSGSVAASGSAASFSSPGLTVSVADNSTTTFKATATDAADNVSGCSAGVTYVEDSSAPALPTGLASNPAGPANNNSPAISGTAEAGSTVRLYTTSDCSGSVAASGSTASFASPGLTVSVADDSSTTFKATATDAAGNVSGCSANSVTYVEDSSPPNSTITFPAGGASYSPSAWNSGCPSPGVCGTAGDGTSGLQKVELSIRRGTGSYFDGSSFASAAEVFLTASGTSSWSYGFAAAQFPVDGNYTIRVRATDNAGNVETASSRTFVFDSSAPAAPSLSFSSFSNASATGQSVYFRPGAAGGFRVTASSSDPDSGISGYAFPALGTGWSGSQSGAVYDYSFDAGAVDPAEPNAVTAQNNAGLSSSTSFTVSADPTAPTTTITCDGGPCAGGWYASAVTITLSASDGGSGLEKIKYTTDGSDPSPLNGSTYGAPFTVNTTTTVRFRAYDLVGNEEAVGSRLVRIDDTAPVAPVLTIAETPASPSQHASGTTLYYNPTGANSGTFTVDAATSDAQSGIDRVTFPALGGMTGGGDDLAGPYEGTYSWTSSSSASGSQTVTAHNTAGLTSSTDFTVTPDSASPTGGSVDYPGGYASGSVTITTDDGADALSGVDAGSGAIERDATDLVDGACDPFPGAWSTVSSPDSTIADGHCYRYRYLVADNVGNGAVYSSPNVVKVSTNAPSAPVPTLAEAPAGPYQHVVGATLYYNPTGANSGSFTVSADVAGSGGSGIERVSFPALSGMTGGGDDPASPYGTSYDWNAGSTASGAQTVTVHNNAGLTSSASFTITPDTAPPAGQTAAVAGGYYTSLAVAVTLDDGSDELSGIDPASGTVERESATLSNGSCVSWSSTWSVVSLSGGSDTTVQSNRCYRYRYLISDRVGNTSAPSAPSADAKIDATAPATSDDAPAAWQNTPVTVTLTVTETGSGTASTVYRVDGGSFQSGTSVAIAAPAGHSNDGTHTIEYRSTDNAGNGEPLRSATVRIDTTLPTTTDDAPAGWQTSAMTVTLTPADALSGIASTEYRLDGGAFQNGTSVSVAAPADHSNDGVHAIDYRSTDNAGNVEPLQAATVRIDTQLPSGALTAPADGAHVNGTVAISAAASDLPSGVVSVEFLVKPNGSGSFTTISTDTTAPYEASWDSTGEPEGNAELEVVVVDNAGLAFTSPVRTIVVDNPPAPTLNDPGANLSGVVTLAATTQPDTAQVVFERSPAGAGTWTAIATDTSAPFEADFDTATVGDGNYDLRAVATDLGGFDGTSPLRTALVDNTAPSVSVTDPANGAIVSGPSVHVAAGATDLGSGVDSVRFEERPSGSGTFTTIGTDTSEPFDAEWDTTSLSGSHELRAVAIDAAGNPATSASITVVVDATAPSVTLSDPGSIVRDVLHLSAAAPHLGIAQVAFERRPAEGGTWTRIALDTTRPWAADFDTRAVADGVYDLRALALGGSGNVLAAHERHSIRVDNTAPTVVSASPANGATVPSATHVVVTASEPVAALQSVSFDGAAATGDISGATVTFSTGPLGPGTHVLEGMLVDAAGNTGRFSVRFTVKVKAHASLAASLGRPKTQARGDQRVFVVPITLSTPATVRATLLSPTGRKLRTIQEKLPAGKSSIRFELPADSVPPGRYTVVVVVTSADGSRVTKRVTVTVRGTTRVKPPLQEPRSEPTTAVASSSGDVAPPAAPRPAAAPTPAPLTKPVKAPSPKPLPQTKLHIPTSKLIATTRDYTGSTSGRTIAFAIVLIALCAGLAFLMKIEISRLLATRRFGGR